MITHLLEIPEELLISILNFCTPTELLQISIISKRLNQITADSILWKRHLLDRMPNELLPENSTKTYFFQTITALRKSAKDVINLIIKYQNVGNNLYKTPTGEIIPYSSESWYLFYLELRKALAQFSPITVAQEIITMLHQQAGDDETKFKVLLERKGHLDQNLLILFAMTQDADTIDLILKSGAAKNVQDSTENPWFYFIMGCNSNRINATAPSIKLLNVLIEHQVNFRAEDNSVGTFQYYFLKKQLYKGESEEKDECRDCLKELAYLYAEGVYNHEQDFGQIENDMTEQDIHLFEKYLAEYQENSEQPLIKKPRI